MPEFEDDVSLAVAKLDAWFDTMRCSGGYGGPVVHWWRDSLFYTGPGLDWRYEGIVLGYLTLYQKTRERRWLKKALRAGYDAVKGQLKNGNFRNSSFEANPRSGGTPHEAALCVALLSIAKILKKEEDARYKEFLSAANKNIQGYYLKHLCDYTGMFRDSLLYPSFVPNKSATLVEALVLLAEFIKNRGLIDHSISTADLIVEHQVSDRNSDFYGAIYQMSLRDKDEFRFTRKFFPFYIARCIPVLVMMHDLVGEKKYLASAKRSLRFLINVQNRDGSFPQVLYEDGGSAQHPCWVAGLGDVLRAFYSLGERRKARDILHLLLSGQDGSGGIRTAHGFANKAGKDEYIGVPDFKDVLHVVGWCDKAFRFLTALMPENEEIPRLNLGESSSECLFYGRKVFLIEDVKSVVARDSSGKVLYQWRKGDVAAYLNLRAVNRGLPVD